jgi:hypothetical protein
MKPNAPLRLGQGHPAAQLAAQNLVFLAQAIVFQGQDAAEKLLDPGYQWVGVAEFRELRFIATAYWCRPTARIQMRPPIRGMKADKFLHPTGRARRGISQLENALQVGKGRLADEAAVKPSEAVLARFHPVIIGRISQFIDSTAQEDIADFLRRCASAPTPPHGWPGGTGTWHARIFAELDCIRVQSPAGRSGEVLRPVLGRHG